MAICMRAGAHELGDFRASSLGTLVRMVAQGLAMTLLPSTAVATEIARSDRIRILPLPRRFPSRTIGLAWRPTSPRHAAFEELGRELTTSLPPGAEPLASR